MNNISFDGYLIPMFLRICNSRIYDEMSYSMREMLEIHGPEEKLSPEELDDFAEYVLSL